MFKFLFKIPEHKSFTHTPIYYNKEKEDLKRRVEGIEAEGTQDIRRISTGSLKESWGRSARISKGNKSSNIRLVTIILILSLLGWLLFFK